MTVTDMQVILQDAMRVIAESTDEIRSGCAIEINGEHEWPDAGDKAEYDRRVAVLESVRALACRPDAQADQARAADPGEELQGWSVTVERNGVRLLTIEKECVAGVENIGDFAPLVRDCAEHLLSFVGRDARADERGAWRTGTPPVPKGKCREFILAVRRAQSNPPGRVFVFAANYANNFTDDGRLSGRDGGDFTAHGWYLCGLDTGGEFDEVYEEVSLNEGDEIVGWQELPKWQEARAAAPQAAAQRVPDLIFHMRVARLLAELHGEETLSEQQCAKIFGVDLVAWRVIKHTFSRGAGWVEGENIDMSGPTTEEAIRETLAAAPSPDREQVGETEGMHSKDCQCPACNWERTHDARECGEPGRPLSDFERVVLEYIAFNDGFINTRFRARQMLDGASECGELQWPYDDEFEKDRQRLSAASAPTLGDGKPIAAWLHVFSIPGKRTEFASIARDVDIPEDFVRAHQKGLVTHVAEPLCRRFSPTLGEPNPTAEPPRWYSVDEIRSRLKSMAYGDEIADELSMWITTEMQLAFNKGFQKGQRAASMSTLGEQEAVAFVSAGWLEHRLGTTTAYPEPHPRVATVPFYTQPQPTTDAARDAKRYRLLRKGQTFSVVDGLGNDLRADELDAAVDERIAREGEA